MTLAIGSDTLRATISPLGAEMQSLEWQGKPLLWNGDAAFWAGRSPVLFPIVGRAEGDVIAVNGRAAEMKQHGFARRSTFDLVEASETACTFALSDSDATRAVYPFAFRLSLTHRIAANRLSVTATVENRDRTPMPFGLGFHPAFLWPLPGAEGAHRITLDNRGEPDLIRLEGGLIGETKLPSPFHDGALTLTPAQFTEDAMIFPEGAGEGLVYAADTGPRLHFRFDNLPNLALWQKPGAPFLCIEPWHGMAARAGAGPEIAARPFSLTLAAGDTATFGFSVEVI